MEHVTHNPEGTGQRVDKGNFLGERLEIGGLCPTRNTNVANPGGAHHIIKQDA